MSIGKHTVLDISYQEATARPAAGRKVIFPTANSRCRWKSARDDGGESAKLVIGLQSLYTAHAQSEHMQAALMRS